MTTSTKAPWVSPEQHDHLQLLHVPLSPADIMEEAPSDRA